MISIVLELCYQVMLLMLLLCTFKFPIFVFVFEVTPWVTTRASYPSSRTGWLLRGPVHQPANYYDGQVSMVTARLTQQAWLLPLNSRSHRKADPISLESTTTWTGPRSNQPVGDLVVFVFVVGYHSSDCRGDCHVPWAHGSRRDSCSLENIVW